MDLSIFDKLSAVQVTADNRITETDRKFCEAQQKAYHQAKAGLQSLKVQWENLQMQQTESLRDVPSVNNSHYSYIYVEGVNTEDFQNAIERLHSWFIERLVKYFNSTYHIEIDYNPIQEFLLPKKPDRYEGTKEEEKEFHSILQSLLLRYEDVLEQIFIQIGGRTFAERALDEVKEKCHAAAWNSSSKEPEYILRNDILQFPSYACSCDNWFQIPKWKLQSNTRDILRGIAHFELGKFGQFPASFLGILGYDNRENIQVFYDCKKVKQLRMFKNGRVDIKFASIEYAEQFVSNYLGLVY